MNQVNRTWITERLMQSLQLLACPPEIQLGKFPPFVHAPDEMAEDFANSRMTFIDNFRPEMSGEQLHYLELGLRADEQELFQPRPSQKLW